MALLLINGSPRGKTGNSRFLIDAFTKGFCRSAPMESVTITDLRNHPSVQTLASSIRGFDTVFIAFPLYVDAMPGMVKALFELLPALGKNTTPLRMGFFVQSGFPESTQSLPLERYLKKLCQRLGYEYLGTVIRGGGEIIRIPPPGTHWFFRMICFIGAHTNLGGVGYLLNPNRLSTQFQRLGAQFAVTSTLDSDMVLKLRSLQKLSAFGFFLYRMIGEHIYWNHLLKKNDAQAMKNAAPFSEKDPAESSYPVSQ